MTSLPSGAPSGQRCDSSYSCCYLTVMPVHDRLGREIPQEPPVEQSLEVDCENEVEPPLDFALNVDSLRFTLVLPQEGQATLSALPLWRRMSFSNGSPQSGQSYSKIG